MKPCVAYAIVLIFTLSLSFGSFELLSNFVVNGPKFMVFNDREGPCWSQGGFKHRFHSSWSDGSRKGTQSQLAIMYTAENTTLAEELSVQYRDASSVTGSFKTARARRVQVPEEYNTNWYEAEIKGLNASTTYQFLIQVSEGQWDDRLYEAKTSGKTEAFEFAFFGDSGLWGREDGLATGTTDVIDLISSWKQQLFVIAAGDFAYFNTDDRFDQLEDAINAWFDQIQPYASKFVVMPTYGNHELSYLRENLTEWKEKFRVPKGFSMNSSRELMRLLSGTDDISLTSKSQPSYYAFTVGTVRFVSILGIQSLRKRGLKSMPDEALDWIEKELRASSRDRSIKWIIPFFHVAPFADGFSHPSVKTLREQLGPLFQKYGVRIVLNAHDQNYERTLPLVIVNEDDYVVTSQETDCYDRRTNGTIYVKTSPGGKKSNIGNTFSKFQTDPPPEYTAFRDDDQHHVLQIRVEENGDEIVAKSWGLPGEGEEPFLLEEFRYTLAERCNE